MTIQIIYGVGGQTAVSRSGTTSTVYLTNPLTFPGTLTDSATITAPNLTASDLVSTQTLTISTFTNPWLTNPGTDNLAVTTDISGNLDWAAPITDDTEYPPTFNAQNNIVSTGYNQGGDGSGSAGTQYKISTNTLQQFDLSTIPGLPSGAGGGFSGAVFDGHYIYFIPNNSGTVSGVTTYNGVIIQYNTTLPIESPSSYAYFDLTTINAALTGFNGGCFDGRYVYFCPTQNSDAIFSGKIVRYDTALSFTSAGSYAFYDVASIDSALIGFSGASFDGRFVYFTQFQINDTPNYGSKVLQYDTTLPFTSSASYANFSVSTLGGTAGTYAFGFKGLVFDGRYMYLVPALPHPVMIRYDTTLPFTTSSSWTYFDLGSVVSWAPQCPFTGGSFDGTNVYFIGGNSTINGAMISYNTTATFSPSSSVSASYLGNYSGHSSFPTTGILAGGVYDGRYLYALPAINETFVCVLDPNVGNLQSNTHQATLGSFDLSVLATGVGYQGGIFDGNRIYYAPSSYSSSGDYPINTILIAHGSYKGPPIIAPAASV